MNYLQAQQEVTNLLSSFYDKATVVVSGQNTTMPQTPYVTVSFGALSQAPAQSGMLYCEDGIDEKYFYMRFPCTIELVTYGTAVDASTQPVDTSVSDLAQFAMFLSSEYASCFLQERNMNVEPAGDCTPIYNLRNDVSVPFRAQLMTNVYFVQEVEDFALIRSPEKSYEQNTSGASSTLAEKKAGYFTKVTI